MEPTQFDFDLSCHGSLYVITPRTPVAREWAEEHLAVPSPPWGESYLAEHRFVPDIARGVLAAGLTLAIDGDRVALEENGDLSRLAPDA